MKNFLFECMSGDCEGEEFIVGEETIEKAWKVASDNFGCVRYICQLTEMEAEASGLDEY